MCGKTLSDDEKKFRAFLRKGVCKPRLARWFQDAGLTDLEKDLLTRALIKGQSREAIARETYSSVATICTKSSIAIRKLMDYFNFVESNPA